MSDTAPPPKRSLLERPLLLHGIFIAVLAVVLAVILILSGAATRLQDSLPLYGQIPAFQLTDQDGEAYTRDNLTGKYTIANFIFTRCPGPCATLTRNFSAFQNELTGRDDIQLLSITVDPKFDQPPVLASYAQANKAQPERWSFITGDSKLPVYELIDNGFKLVARENEDPNTPLENLFIHSTRMVLIDPDGQIRGYYDGTLPESYDAVLADIDKLERF